MNEQKRLLGYYDYTVVLTYAGMLSGFLGLTQVLAHRYQQALICLMVSGICDMFDGAVAATKQRTADEKHFGIQIDSLSDLICFGIFPALFVYDYFHGSTLSYFSAAAYALAALIRLAYFNVMELNRQQVETGTRKYYQGLPVTTIALLLPAAYVLYLNPAMLLVIAALFLLPIRIPKPHFVGKICACVAGLAELFLLIAAVVGGT